MSFHVAYDDSYVHPVPEGHRFPMEKYQLLYEQLRLEGIISPETVLSTEIIDHSTVERVHTKEYLDKLLRLKCTPREQRVSGFEHTLDLINRELHIMDGTRKCAEIAASEGGIAFNIAGGTHHAYTNRGEGFCLLNDQAIAAQWLLDNQLASKVLIIDLDVHQGNGTAEIFSENEAVFTFSMHGEHNYPLHKEQSDLDVGLKDGTRDEEYLYLLDQSFETIAKRFTPDFVFYQCGVDIIETDKLGRLGVSMQGCRKRDERVFEFVKALGVPVVCSMGGGYSKEIRHIIEAHANTFRVAQKYF